MKILIPLISLLFNHLAYSQTSDYAVTIKLRGTVEVTINGETKKLKKGERVPAGAVLTSKEKSFAVIKMSDETKLTLGPSSSIEVQVVSGEGKPGLINILKGQLRSKVKPDKIKKGNKLFIKANMAALGVRGTETVITYNPKNNSFTTGGLTGEVVISPIKDKNINVNELKKTLDNKNPNLIKLPKQFFSAIQTNGSDLKITKPQKMNSVQYFALLRNPEPKFRNSQKKLNNLRPISLPNVPPADDIIIDMALSPEVVEEAKNESAEINSPEFTDNSSTPIAGALVDFNTGTIINPSPTDPVDPVTGMRTPTTNMGTIGADGSYQPPVGLKLSDAGTFEIATTNGETRSPASIPGVKVASNGEIALPSIPKLEEINIELLDFNDGELIEAQNTEVSTTNNNNLESSSTDTKDTSSINNSQLVENSTGVQNDLELGDNIINVENDCPNRKLCDNFNSVSPTTTDTITKTAVQFNIIIKK